MPRWFFAAGGMRERNRFVGKGVRGKGGPPPLPLFRRDARFHGRSVMLTWRGHGLLPKRLVWVARIAPAALRVRFFFCTRRCRVTAAPFCCARFAWGAWRGA